MTQASWGLSLDEWSIVLGRMEHRMWVALCQIPREGRAHEDKGHRSKGVPDMSSLDEGARQSQGRVGPGANNSVGWQLKKWHHQLEAPWACDPTKATLEKVF